jgi:hypothetical protein
LVEHSDPDIVGCMGAEAAARNAEPSIDCDHVMDATATRASEVAASVVRDAVVAHLARHGWSRRGADALGNARWVHRGSIRVLSVPVATSESDRRRLCDLVEFLSGTADGVQPGAGPGLVAARPRPGS